MPLARLAAGSNPLSEDRGLVRDTDLEGMFCVVLKRILKAQ